MSTFGKSWADRMAQQNLNHAHYVKNKLKEKGLDVISEEMSSMSLLLECKEPLDKLSDKLLNENIVSGYDVSKDIGIENALLLCVTEKRTKEEMDTLIDVLTKGVN